MRTQSVTYTSSSHGNFSRTQPRWPAPGSRMSVTIPVARPGIRGVREAAVPPRANPASDRSGDPLTVTVLR